MPKGLLNLGNTCYMNAGLQMLLANQDFCQLINKYSQNEKIKIINDFINEYNGSSQQIAPMGVKQLVGQSDAMFAGFIQNDASEFVVKLLDIVENIIKEINTNEMFSIKFKSIIKCKKRDCLEKSQTYYSNNFLLLELYPDIFTLEGLYKKFKTSEILSGNEKFMCGKCKVKRVASKKTKIDTWSNHLIIWLKRFTSNGRSFSKNCQRIEVPLKWRHNYELKGGIIHDGGLGGGHYYWVGNYDNKWLVCNDGSVSQIDEQRALQILSGAYWLYYQKKNINLDYSSDNAPSPDINDETFQEPEKKQVDHISPVPIGLSSIIVGRRVFRPPEPIQVQEKPEQVQQLQQQLQQPEPVPTMYKQSDDLINVQQQSIEEASQQGKTLNHGDLRAIRIKYHLANARRR